MHASQMEVENITSSLSYLVATARYAFSRLKNRSTRLRFLYSSAFCAQGFLRFRFDGTTGLYLSSHAVSRVRSSE